MTNENNPPTSPQNERSAPKSDIMAAADEALGGALFSNLEDLLTKLVPESDVIIRDCWGNKISLPSALPARRQIKVFRIFQEIADHPSVTKNFTGGVDMAAGDIVDLVMAIAGDEEVAELLGKAFALAHPDVLDGKDPLDVLPVEEIVAGLVPFFVRFLQRGMGAMGSLSGMLPQS